METERDALQHELVAELLLSIGWKSSNDAQWEGLRDALPKLAALASLAPAAVEGDAVTNALSEYYEGQSRFYTEYETERMQAALAAAYPALTA
jgi:hypothetical protein